jgi:hypothetical protein
MPAAGRFDARPGIRRFWPVAPAGLTEKVSVFAGCTGGPTEKISVFAGCTGEPTEKISVFAGCTGGPTEKISVSHVR